MGSGAIDDSSTKMAENKRHSVLVGFLGRLVKEKPLGTVGAVITLLLLLTGIFANFLAPYGMNETHEGDLLAPPSAKYWLGADNLGRDVLSRVVYGARVSVIVGLVATTIATVVSMITGVFSGYFGGKFDLIVQRLVDAWMCFPWLILTMVLMSIVGTGIWQVIIVIGVTWGIGGSRILRGATIGIKENTYVSAAAAIGCPPLRILTRHILPNIMPTIIVQFSTQVPGIILVEASLSFMGLGIPAPTPSWGGMLSGSGRSYMFMAPWMALWPGLALSIVVYGVNVFGDALRDILDPRLRGGIGRYGVRVMRSRGDHPLDRRQGDEARADAKSGGQRR